MIHDLLAKYRLPTSFDEIKKYRTPAWELKVKDQIEEAHRQKLIDSCYKMENGALTPKTKTITIAQSL